MSLGARATKGGAKTGKEGRHAPEKGKGIEKAQIKEKIKPQATTEQLRMANMIDRKGDDASDVRRMVLELMEMTCRTEEEVCSALHDADNDMQVACNLLLEEAQRIQGEWQTSEKKKKKPAAPVGNGDLEPPRDPRSRSGPRQRRSAVGGGGGAPPPPGAPPRGRGSGRGRGGGVGGRGRGGGAGGRGRGRGGGVTHSRGHYHHGDSVGDSFPAAEDWDNEEWSGSLTDTKVFTPSASVQNAVDESMPAQNINSVEDWDAPAETNNGHTEAHIPSYTYHNAQAPQLTPQQLPRAPTAAVSPKPDPVLDNYHAATHQHQPMGMSGTLSAAQSQYLSQLTQQSQRHDNSVYTSNYGGYGATELAQRKPQRARVPPPSKIPSTAVEMPGGGDATTGAFLDVQFGVEPDAELDPQPIKQQVTPQPPTQPVQNHEVAPESNIYNTSNNMLNESLSTSLETPPASQPVVSEPQVTSTTSLEKQVTASMKQLSVSASQHSAHAHARTKPTVPSASSSSATAGGVYAAHAPHVLPPVYGANMYTQQVNSSNGASLSAQQVQPAAITAAYPSSVTLSQYQPIINSYQQTSSSGGVYGGAPLYTAAPYSAYQPTHNKLSKDTSQYDSSVASSNSLTSTTTQSSTSKVTTSTACSGSVSGGGGGGGSTSYGVASPAALYGQQPATTYAYDDQCLRTLPHHMGGYYEVGYGVGGARDASFGLGGAERFGRADAASPQQVPAALPPGYAYFYQPPPTTYQYGVYPYGGGSSVGGVGGVGSVGGGKVQASYTQQQPPYETADTYKAGGYSGKTGGAAAAPPTDLSSAMYAKAHVALNKVNSYEKATFHSGTPPPFGAASHHLYIPAPPHHHHHLHQMDVRVNSSHNRRESGGAGGAGAAAATAARQQAKPAAAKQAPYSQSYWPPN